MKFPFLPVALMFLGLQSPAQTTLTDSFQHNGVWRSFRVYVPAALPAQSPLILNMHGLGSDALAQQYYSLFMPIADTAKFLMVYPQGLYNAQYNATYWNAGFSFTAGADDVGFLSALIDTMQARYATDPNRVYSTGMSMGGYMTDYLACQLSGKITAIASVTGSMVPDVQTTCTPSGIMPSLHIHGTADFTVPYTGNANGLHVDSVVAHWRRINNCLPTPVVTNLPNTNTTDNSTVTHYVWNDSSGKTSVELYKVNNGGHTWPGSPVTIGTTNQDFSASKEIWRFFRQYRKGGSLGTSQVTPKADVAIYPNPCTHTLTLQEADINTHVRILTLTGSLALEVLGNKVDVSKLPSGTYLASYGNGKQTFRSRFVKE